MPIAIGPFPDRLQDQTDVNLTDLADQDLLKWDAGTGKFVRFSGLYQALVYTVSGGDFTFLKDTDGNPIHTTEHLE